LLTLFQSMVALIKKVKPDVAALETLFFNTNVTTAFSVGQARGVVMLSLAQANIPVVEYNPMQVKVALTGYGAAKKMQLNRMVAQILHLSKPLAPDDVADAAAIALTHCFSYKLKRLENISR
ncbi:crossover junction endodeoxyribonuclease RuvC, partial [Candidatus Gottesmanbacteria bacterium]|nr:crossover junction endodeoxyribonuclease RuvC [Candidatus Gottesmanbacteria bacterium]